MCVHICVCVNDNFLFISDGKLDTELVYGILLRSGLPRPMLGNVWNLANKSQPGVLEQHELYIALSLIALIQVDLCEIHFNLM